jgi:hypothetical protein
MRVLILLALSAFTLAGCDSPYGTDYAKNDDSNAPVSTGSHIRGGGGSSTVQMSNGGTAIDSATHSSAAGRNTLGN